MRYRVSPSTRCIHPIYGLVEGERGAKELEKDVKALPGSTLMSYRTHHTWYRRVPSRSEH
jgi:hypothetical protein